MRRNPHEQRHHIVGMGADLLMDDSNTLTLSGIYPPKLQSLRQRLGRFTEKGQLVARADSVETGGSAGGRTGVRYWSLPDGGRVSSGVYSRRQSDDFVTENGRQEGVEKPAIGGGPASTRVPASDAGNTDHAT